MGGASKFIKKHGWKLMGIKPNESYAEAQIEFAPSPYILSHEFRCSSAEDQYATHPPAQFQSSSLEEKEVAPYHRPSSKEPRIVTSLSDVRKSTEFYAVSLVEGSQRLSAEVRNLVSFLLSQIESNRYFIMH
jgi:hypothetical protein